MSQRTIHPDQNDEAAERSLGIVAELISEPDLWGDWISEDSDRGSLLEQASACVKRLAEHTDWTLDELLFQLGCRKRKADELREMNLEQLRRCSDYFRWIEELSDLVDRATERRRVAIGGARLFRQARRDLRAARWATRSGDFPPVDYLRLGEIDKAFAVSKSELDGIRRPDPGPTHLRAKRVDRYLDADDESIGPRMRKRIADHLANCRECSNLVEARVGRPAG